MSGSEVDGWGTIKATQNIQLECEHKWKWKSNWLQEIAKQSANARIMCFECKHAIERTSWRRTGEHQLGMAGWKANKKFQQWFIYMWYELWNVKTYVLNGNMQFDLTWHQQTMSVLFSVAPLAFCAFSLSFIFCVDFSRNVCEQQCPCVRCIIWHKPATLEMKSRHIVRCLLCTNYVFRFYLTELNWTELKCISLVLQATIRRASSVSQFILCSINLNYVSIGTHLLLHIALISVSCALTFFHSLLKGETQRLFNLFMHCIFTHNIDARHLKCRRRIGLQLNKWMCIQ